jgi:tetratricopeptide (TPR) repeat protein
LACSSLGDEAQARDSFQKSVQSRSDPSEASECSDLDYYRGMSLKKLGEEKKGIRILSELQRVGEARVKLRSGLDYFAKFGEQQSEFSRVAQLHYCIGLGMLGLGDRKKAAAEFARALQLNPNHAWALFQLRGIK